jgi:hypothetical protein
MEAHGKGLRRGVRRCAVRALIAVGLTLLALALPATAGAQTYCPAGYQAVPSPYFSSFVPTGYTAYSGFASYPGAFASGTLPAGYGTNPYSVCQPVGTSPGTGSTPSYSVVYPSNVYNPYSGYGVTNPASYPYVSAAQQGYPGDWSGYSYSNAYGGWTPYAGYGFAAFPGIAPSGYLSSSSSGASQAIYGNAGIYTPTPSSYSSPYYSPSGSAPSGTYPSAGYPGYTTGASAYSAYGSPFASYGSNYGYSGYGYNYGYGAYGPGGGAAYSGPATMITWGR